MPLDAIRALVIGGKVKRIAAAVQTALDEDCTAGDIVSAMSEAMGEVGRMFHHSEIYVPEMLISAMTMKKGLAQLYPTLTAGSLPRREKVILGTVQGDLHDIGKNLAGCMLESAGFQVIDLGVDVAPETFVAELKNNPDCHFLGLSCLLTTTIPSIQNTITLLEESGLREQVFILVGGAPLSKSLADSLGADCYTADASMTAQAATEQLDTMRCEMK